MGIHYRYQPLADLKGQTLRDNAKSVLNDYFWIC